MFYLIKTYHTLYSLKYFGNYVTKLLDTYLLLVLYYLYISEVLMGYDELQEQVTRYDNAQKARRKENYRYARDKGFTPKQAMILAGKSKEEIDKTAEDRDSKKDGAPNG